jgi:hypothetical protein
MWMDKMTETNKTSTKVGEPLEATDEQLDRVKQGLLNAIASTGPNEHQITIGRDHYALLKKMEDYAQDLAGLVVRYFKEKDLEARNDLILKAVEVLKLNPAPGPGSDVNRYGPSLLNR